MCGPGTPSLCGAPIMCCAQNSIALGNGVIDAWAVMPARLFQPCDCDNEDETAPSNPRSTPLLDDPAGSLARGTQDFARKLRAARGARHDHGAGHQGLKFGGACPPL